MGLLNSVLTIFKRRWEHRQKLRLLLKFPALLRSDWLPVREFMAMFRSDISSSSKNRFHQYVWQVIT